MTTPSKLSDSALAKIQSSLSVALRHWLYQTVSARSFHKNNFLKYFLRSAPLQCCAQEFQNAGLTYLQTHLQKKHIISCTQYADILAHYYRQWEEILLKEKAPACSTGALPIGKDFSIWSKQGGFHKKYQPVRMLYNFLQSTESFYTRAIVHGSIPTLEDQDGFSDMDLAFVIKSEALKNPKSLMNLREQSRTHIFHTYSFDPFMHHGPYYLAEMDFMWYPQPIFPTVLFKYGLELLNNPPEQKYAVRNDSDTSQEALNNFLNFFSKRCHTDYHSNNRHELEWVLGSTMLLPALFLQQLTGEYLFKRETFPNAKCYFTEKEWAPIQLASTLRTSLAPRALPGNAVLELAKKTQWPGLLQRTANYLPQNRECTKIAFSLLGREFPHQVIALIEAMRQKLKQNEQ